MSAPLIVALGGRVVGLDAATGETLWHNELQGSGVGFVALAVNDDFVVASASAAACSVFIVKPVIWRGLQRLVDWDAQLC